ncbi:MAG: hypothetical protein KKA90_01915 [Nanoarchaeota archaeon]|nr:hypothetical protein [Nanoarchaeota archaeon]
MVQFPPHVEASLSGQVFVEASEILQNLFYNIYASLLSLLPSIVAALIVIIIGWIVGKSLGFVLTHALNKVKIDHWIRRHGLGQALYGKRLSAILGALLKWYIVIVFISQAVALIHLDFLTFFLQNLVLYVPAFIGAILVILAGLLIGEYVKRTIIDSKMMNKELVADGSKLLIVFFTVVVGLQTAGFSVDILVDAFRIAFAALAASVAIVIGISFGFAFRKDAEKILQNFRKKQ